MAEMRKCLHCGNEFKARKSQIDAGHGKYCSQRCNYDAKGHQHLSSPENLKKATEARRASIAANGTKHPRGPANHRWAGGPEEARKRKVKRARRATFERTRRTL